jgi:hypothetical protein
MKAFFEENRWEWGPCRGYPRVKRRDLRYGKGRNRRNPLRAITIEVLSHRLP